MWIAEALRSGPFSVNTITAVPNYPQGVVYPGYRAWRATREVIGGVSTTRCPVYPSHDRSAVGRAVNYSSFALSSTWVGRKVLNSADVTLVYSSPATAALGAMVAHSRAHVPYVLLIQDLWPDTVLQTGMLESGAIANVAERVLSRFDDRSTEGASHILVISPGMKDALVGRGVPKSKISVMFNWVDESVLYPRKRTGALRRDLGIPPQHLVLMYAGNHGAAQGLWAWVEAMEGTRDLGDVHLVLVGEGTEKASLRERVDALGLDNVHFHPPVSVDDLATLAADADAQIVSLTDAPLFRITIPGKVQATLALGSAVLGSVAGDAAAVLEESGAGILAAPEDVCGIEAAIRQARTEGRSGLVARGLHGREFYLQHMSRTTGTEILTRVLQDAAREGRPIHGAATH